jgi:hypothetical protein
VRCRGGERVPFVDRDGATVEIVCRDPDWGNGDTAGKREEAIGRARVCIIPGGEMRALESIKDKLSEGGIGEVLSTGTLGIG